MKTINIICLTLAIIGAINWGLIGFFDYNLVNALFGSGSAISRVVFGIVGLAGLYLITFYGYVSRSES